MSKRFISIFTAICVLLCSITFTAAAKADADYSQAVEMVKAFGVYSPESNSGVMTRGEFALIVSNILNYGTALSNVNGQFTDVTVADSFSGAVYDLVSRKIISGYTTDSFKPDSPILYEQAIKIILSAAGYDQYVEAKRGSYPSSYMLAASERDLTDNMDKSIGETLTPYETAQLIANALELSVFRQTSFGGEESFEVTENVTLMSEYMGVKKVEGIIKDNGITSLTGESKTGRDFVVIGSKEYKAAGTNASELLGYRVDAFVTEKEDRLVYIRPYKHTEVITVKADRLLKDSTEFSVTSIVYTDIYDRTRKLPVKLGADFIYNGKAYNDLRVDLLKLSAGELVLIDNNNDGTYDVVHVNSARIMVTSGVNAEFEIIYDKIKKDEPLSMRDAEIVRIIKDGVEVSLNSIREWDVLSVYESVDNSIITVQISSDKITGTVSEFSDGEQVIGINGEYYHVTDSTVFSSIKLGQGYEFCLDSDMNIAAVKDINTDSKNVAYFVKAAPVNGINSKVQVKLYTTVGSHVVYNCAKKISVDGDKTKTSSEIIDYLTTNATKNLISFKLNSEGEIREINLPYVGIELPDNKKGLLHKYHFEPQAPEGQIGLTYSSAQRTLKGMYALSTDIKVLQIPLSPEPDDEEFSVNGIGYFGNQNNYDNFDLYSFGEEDARADFMVIFKDPQPQYTGGTYPVVVSKIKHVLTNSGDYRECLIGYDHRGAIEYIAKDDSLFTNAGIKTGDVVRCPMNILGEVSDVRLIYDGQNKLVVSDITGGFGFSDYRGFAGDVYSKYGSLLGLFPNDKDGKITQVTNKGILSVLLADGELADAEKNEMFEKIGLRLYDIATSKIYIVDETEGKPTILEGTVDSIYDYLTTQDNFSSVYIHDIQAVPRMVVVYQR